MVRTLAIHLNDNDFEELKEMKLEWGLTWEDFILKAAHELDKSDRAD